MFHHAEGRSHVIERAAARRRQTPTPAGDLSIQVRVLDSEGDPVELAEVVLWRPVRPGEDAAKCSWRGSPVHWHDSSSALMWKVCAARERGAKPVFEGLRPGEYRVTAAGNIASKWDDVTPVGMSPAVQLDGTQMNATVTVIQQQGECSLVVKVVDAATRQPVKHATALLVRSDGLPMAWPASGRFRGHTNAQGVLRYAKLVPGTYWLHDVAKRSSVYGDSDYKAAQQRIRVDVTSYQDNKVEVPVHTVTLDQDEIASRWPFVVTGRVTSAQGLPMSGVEVHACAGIATMWQTGKCVTDEEGGYRLRFTGAYWQTVDWKSGERRVGFQSLGVFASKLGYFEQNLCRQGKLAMAGKAPAKWQRDRYVGVVEANKPYRLDFAMAPAATIKGRLLSDKGQPISNRKLWPVVKELPPYCNTLSGATTDDQGRFTFPSVPLQPCWFCMQLPASLREEHGNEVGTSPIDLPRPGVYEVELVYRGSLHIECKLIRSPSSSSAPSG